MRRRNVISGIFMPAAGLLACVGCDSGPRRMAVSGNVTWKGAPLKDGTISFIPLTTGTQSGTGISEGKYSISREQGLSPGMYRVSINSPDGMTPIDPNTPPGPSGNFASKERIPSDFNENSKHEVEVTASGQNRFDFKIP
jgi:hypothetical protein